MGIVIFSKGRKVIRDKEGKGEKRGEPGRN